MRAMYFASIAHELRTPLNTIIPMLRMIITSFPHLVDPKVLR